MPKPVLTQRILSTLLGAGFYFVSQKGSHTKYRSRTTPVRTVIVPIHGKEIPFGTFRSIVRQSGLDISDFE